MQQRDITVHYTIRSTKHNRRGPVTYPSSKVVRFSHPGSFWGLVNNSSVSLNVPTPSLVIKSVMSGVRVVEAGRRLEPSGDFCLKGAEGTTTLPPPSRTSPSLSFSSRIDEGKALSLRDIDLTMGGVAWGGRSFSEARGDNGTLKVPVDGGDDEEEGVLVVVAFSGKDGRCLNGFRGKDE